MASLNDYNWRENKRRHGVTRRLSKFLWLQAALSLVLVLAVAALIGHGGMPGAAARYLAGPALSEESSWFSFGRSPAALPAAAPAQTALPETALPATTLKFSAPASGVVVKGVKLDAAGLTTEQGVIIQGVAGQNVKAAAAGEVLYMGETDGGFIVEIGHAEGFSSVYQGLSELAIGAGQQVAAGETLGVTATGEVLFALFVDDVEVDPLVYLFQQQV